MFSFVSFFMELFRYTESSSTPESVIIAFLCFCFEIIRFNKLHGDLMA